MVELLALWLSETRTKPPLVAVLVKTSKRPSYVLLKVKLFVEVVPTEVWRLPLPYLETRISPG